MKFHCDFCNGLPCCNMAEPTLRERRSSRADQEGIELNLLPAIVAMEPDAGPAVVPPMRPPMLAETPKAWYNSIVGSKNRQTTDLLGSKQWSNARINKLDGMLQRLEMIEQSKMPAMRVLPMRKLEELGRIPRSTEEHAVPAYDAVKKCGQDEHGHAKAVLVFFSHRWLRADWCSAAGENLAWGTEEREKAMEDGLCVGEPDCADHQKARALIQWGRWFKWWRQNTLHPYFKDITRADDMEILFWIDWPCVNQKDPAPDMAALPAIVGACSVILAYASEEYRLRAWCQVELLMAYAFMNTGKVVFGLTEGFRHQQQHACKVEELVVLDPVQGQLTNHNDRRIIATLQQAAVSSDAFSCSKVFFRMSSESPGMCLLYNCVGVMGCCGALYWRYSRRVELGQSVQRVLIPTVLEQEMTDFA